MLLDGVRQHDPCFRRVGEKLSLETLFLILKNLIFLTHDLMILLRKQLSTSLKYTSHFFSIVDGRPGRKLVESWNNPNCWFIC